MSPQRRDDGAAHILFDADAVPAPEASFFDPAYWRDRGSVAATAPGRGAACIFEHDGRRYVLRHYRRGGLIARISEDRYRWTGLERTRAFREWRLLAKMRGEGLPVPGPVAARVQRHGWTYSADLVTAWIPATETLADRLGRAGLAPDAWQRIGATIARIHRAGVWHADLNARNVLLDEGGAVFLVDFDKAEVRRSAGAWRAANLQRLRRSLEKFRAGDPGFRFDQASWDELLRGYRRDAPA